MSTIMKRYTKGIVLKGETTDVTENAEGSLFQNSAELRLKAYIEGAVRQIVTNTQSQVLTNKTIDADNNSVSNIQTSNLKSGVLNTSTTLSGATNTQLPSALAVKTYIDDKAAAQNEASEISFVPAGTIAATNVQAMGQELDGDIQGHITSVSGAHAASAISNTPSGNLAATTVQAALNELQTDVDTRAINSDLTNHTSASANVHGIGVGNSVVGTGTAQAITNKTIDADLNTISNIDNADIKANAGIDATKIADGSVSNAEFQYLGNVTSDIQTQINSKVNASGGTLTNGSLVTPVRSDVKQDTKANLTTYATTASNGQVVFATDTKEYLAVKDGALTALGGGGTPDIDALLVQSFDTAALTDFTQTGLELVQTGPLNGAQSARLVHQAASTRSFKQTLSVPPKFRGVNMTAALTVRSTAAQGNVTIQFRDETNSVDYPSQQIQTNSQIITSLTTTNSSPTVSGFTTATINSLRAGMSVTGPGIATGTTISAVNSTALTITLSQNATASATVSLSFSDLPRTVQLGFQIPANCSSYSYTISALQESGSPETYIDDVTLRNYWYGMSNQGQSQINVPVITDWQTYTPTFQGFGTPTNVEFEWRQVGQNVEIRGKFTSGTPTAVEARIGLPNGLTSANTDLIPSIQVVGKAGRGDTAGADYVVLAEPSTTYVTIGNQSATGGSYVKQNGSSAVNGGSSFGFFASVPCAGLTSQRSIVTNDIVPAKAVLGNTTLNMPRITAWQGYTPTFQGFGTPSVIEFEWRQVGQDVEIRGKFTAGTPTGVEARVGLPAGLTSAGTDLIPSLSVAGDAAMNSTLASTYRHIVLMEPSVTYVTFGNSAGAGTVNQPLAKMTGSAMNAGQILSFTAKVPCAGLQATEEVVVSGTQSALVQEADSVLVARSNAGQSITANVTNIPFILSSIQGSDIIFNGNTFSVTTDGIYEISVGVLFSGAGTRYLALYANGTMNLSLSPSLNSTLYTGIVSTRLTPGVTYSIRSNDVGGTLTVNGDVHYLIVTKQNALKQLNVSSDQKIKIPTSELRMEGASSRGSTATAIVRFDTLAKLRGDAFSIVNDATNGTAITILKAGKLDISATVQFASAVSAYLSKNQVTLTGIPTQSEILAASSWGDSFTQIGWSGFVAVGDIIRISTNVNPTNSSSANSLNLSFQEQEVAVSVTNTLPQFSESDSSVRVDTANGYGSTANKIRRFSNIRDNIGTDIEYNDSATNGSSFTVKSTGIYSVTYCDIFPATVSFGISKNASSLTTAIGVLPNAERLTSNTTSASNFDQSCSWIGHLAAGDIIRPQTDGVAGTGASASFTISKVGKPNVTGVDVTPFVKIPQNDVDRIETNYFVTTALLDTAGELRFDPAIFVTRANKGIITVEDDSANTRTKFTALKRCTVDVSFSAASSIAGSATLNKNGAGYQEGGFATAGNFSIVSASVNLEPGEFISFTRASIVAASGYTIKLTATAASDSIITANESFSTDTALLQYASSAQYTLSTLANAPVGTFITWSFAANGNTSTQTTVAPTQTTSDMNVNGILLYGRAWTGASTAAQPSLVAIQIGKGFKGCEVDGFLSSGKTSNVSKAYRFVRSAASERGYNWGYNPTTGILTLDLGYAQSGSNTSFDMVNADSTASGTNAYFVINASKSPALAGVPLLQPRIATISYELPSGTNGGGITSGAYQTRPLNTLVDPTGIVTSLASNQVTLSKGTYYLEAQAQSRDCIVNKLKIRNITDSTDLLIGINESTNPERSSSFIRGSFTLTSTKTLELQQRCSLTRATDGMGTPATFGDVEVYTTITLQKIKD